jgi:hypothetical protein
MNNNKIPQQDKPSQQDSCTNTLYKIIRRTTPVKKYTPEDFKKLERSIINPIVNRHSQ